MINLQRANIFPLSLHLRKEIWHLTPGGSGTASDDGYRHKAGPHASSDLLDKVRALPRLGALKTLDLKGNDLRVSIIV